MPASFHGAGRRLTPLLSLEVPWLTGDETWISFRSRAAACASAFNLSYGWEVNVLEARQINAFCLPGGKIAVFTGLFSIVENDDQLATVLSHEIAHALAHHASERIARPHDAPPGAQLLSNFVN